MVEKVFQKLWTVSSENMTSKANLSFGHFGFCLSFAQATVGCIVWAFRRLKNQEVVKWAPAATRFIAYARNFPFSCLFVIVNSSVNCSCHSDSDPRSVKIRFDHCVLCSHVLMTRLEANPLKAVRNAALAVRHGDFTRQTGRLTTWCSALHSSSISFNAPKM